MQTEVLDWNRFKANNFVFYEEENEEIEIKLQELEKECDRKESVIKNLRLKKEQLYEKMITYRKDSESNAKLNKSLNSKADNIKEIHQTEIKSLKSENKLLIESENLLKSQIINLNEENKSFKNLLEATEIKLKEKNNSLMETEYQISNLDNEIKALKSSLKDLEISYIKLQDENNKLVQTANLEKIKDSELINKEISYAILNDNLKELCDFDAYEVILKKLYEEYISLNECKTQLEREILITTQENKLNLQQLNIFQNDLSKSNEEIKELRKEKASFDTQNINLKNNLNDLKISLNKLKEDNNSLNESNIQMTNQIKKLQDGINQKNKEIKNLKSKFQEENNLLKSEKSQNSNLIRENKNSIREINKLQDDLNKSNKEIQRLKEETISIIAAEKNKYNNLKLQSDNLEVEYPKLQEEYNSLNDSKIGLENMLSIKIQEIKIYLEQISILQNLLKKRDEEKASLTEANNQLKIQNLNLTKDSDNLKNSFKKSQMDINALTETKNQLANQNKIQQEYIDERNKEIENLKAKFQEENNLLESEKSQNSNSMIEIRNLNAELIVLKENLNKIKLDIKEIFLKELKVENSYIVNMFKTSRDFIDQNSEKTK
jgi:chromosome segregation ATPase